MRICISLYEQHNTVSYNQNDFSICYPIQPALLNAKNEQRLIEHIKKTIPIKYL